MECIGDRMLQEGLCPNACRVGWRWHDVELITDLVGESEEEEASAPSLDFGLVYILLSPFSTQIVLCVKHLDLGFVDFTMMQK